MDSVSSLFEAHGPTTLTWFYQVNALHYGPLDLPAQAHQHSDFICRWMLLLLPRTIRGWMHCRFRRELQQTAFRQDHSCILGILR